MSQQYRSTQSSIESSSGSSSGCAVLLIIIGLGIAFVAIGVGVVAAFITLDDSTTEAVVPEPTITVMTPTPVETPIAFVTPTLVPTATAVPLENEDESGSDPQALGEAADTDYEAFASETILSLADSLIDISISWRVQEHATDSGKPPSMQS